MSVAGNGSQATKDRGKDIRERAILKVNRNFSVADLRAVQLLLDSAYRKHFSSSSSSLRPSFTDLFW